MLSQFDFKNPEMGIVSSYTKADHDFMELAAKGITCNTSGSCALSMLIMGNFIR